MLVHPEIYAFLNRQSATESPRKRESPLVARTKKINKGGAEKARQAQLYDSDAEEERQDEVEYLNERKSNLNFYA